MREERLMQSNHRDRALLGLVHQFSCTLRIL